MKNELLDEINSLLSYSKEAGMMTWKVAKKKGSKIGDKAGSKEKFGYISLKLNGKYHKVHRLAWFMSYGVWPKGDIDHINGIRDDNRLCNLRDVTTRVNMQNQRKAMSVNKSGFLGVGKQNSYAKFRSRITVNGKCLYLGVYDTAEQAHKVYLDAKRKYHEGSTI
jgi:HNH endonuclease